MKSPLARCIDLGLHPGTVLTPGVRLPREREEQRGAHRRHECGSRVREVASKLVPVNVTLLPPRVVPKVGVTAVKVGGATYS